VKYVLLLSNDAADVERWKAMPEDEARASRAAEVPRWNAVFERMQERGQLRAGVELDGPETARTIRVVDGEPVVTDGPYAETKEVVGGLVVVECDDLDETIELAAAIPLASRGSVEIRPVAP
jgi:hypothetical protein